MPLFLESFVKDWTVIYGMSVEVFGNFVKLSYTPGGGQWCENIKLGTFATFFSNFNGKILSKL